ncbi:hypothetical protein SAMN03080598_03473 [Algoriphagus boritolerans DSM 17298 = JCM 18970]|uniref:Uncharacterized protein n=2 Tax=Algoriphagus TaxID=246875 RepID=A0A1H5ZFB7_9BACT|nr:hypothetical protein SAMN03080598_03473 [Algoriphagus boritolerans DSM 17298 = JCM 18970]
MYLVEFRLGLILCEKSFSLSKKKIMKPSAPQKITWIIGILCGILGILGHFAQIQFISEYSFTLLMVGFIALALGTSLKGV